MKTYRALDKEVPRAAVDNVMNLLLQSGYLEPEAFLAANEIANAPLYTPPPPAAFTSSSETPAFARRSEAFESWLIEHSARSLLQNTVVDPYGSEWGNAS